MKTLIKLIIVIESIVLLSSVNSCNNFSNVKSPNNNELIGLASPIHLKVDTTIVHITDYFPNNPKFDSIVAENSINVLIKDSVIKLYTNNTKLPQINTLSFYLKDDKYSILLIKSKKIKYKYTFSTSQKYNSVKVMGEFNAWNPENTILQQKNSLWETTLLLNPGTYQYLVKLDGVQQIDPANNDSVSNNMGGYNSVLKIGNSNNNTKPYIFLYKHSADQITIGSKNNFSKLVVFYNNIALPTNYIEKLKKGVKIHIPADSKEQHRSYIRIWAANSTNISNDILVPLNYGKVVTSTKQLTRTDFEAATIYNTFIDRFCDGNKKNTWQIKDKNVLPKANYFGGDLEGITKKITSGYFKNLGINTIWISPVIKNPEKAYGFYPNPKTKFSAYHGYWPISFTQINPHFGNDSTLKNLVDIAHKNNINVLLDFVANHVHKEHPMYKKHPEYATSLYLPDGSLNTEKWDTHRLTTWFDTFLPTLDLTNPKVYNMLSDSAVYWIKKFDLDGFRHDATKHIPQIFWQTLTIKLKKQVIIPNNKKLFQIGETYGSPELISQYVNTGELDAQFDFNIYDALITTIATKRSFKDLTNEINKSFQYYGYHNKMGIITGNQDRARFISYASGSLRFDEDAKKAGWTRNITVKDTVGYKKAAMLNCLVATIPGIPVIFYGDEIGMPGGNDPDNRRMMKFDNLNKHEQNLLTVTSKLLNFRRNSMPLIFGDFKVIKANENTLIFQRTYFQQTVIVIINNSDKTITINNSTIINYKKLTALFNNQLEHNNSTITVSVPANSFKILSNQITTN